MRKNKCIFPSLIIPTIQPDEIIFSYINRLKNDNDLTEILLKQVLKEHFTALSNMNNTMYFLDSISKILGMPTEQFVDRHTMSNESLSANLILYHFKFNPYSQSFYFRKKAKFCPLCCEGELKRSGLTFWHRWHQVRGVFACDTHETALLTCDTLNPFNSQPHMVLQKGQYTEQHTDSEWRNPVIKKYLHLAKCYLNDKYSIDFLGLIDTLVERAHQLDGCIPTRSKHIPVSRRILQSAPKQWALNHFPFFKQLNNHNNIVQYDCFFKSRIYKGSIVVYLLYIAFLLDDVSLAYKSQLR